MIAEGGGVQGMIGVLQRQVPDVDTLSMIIHNY